MSLREKNGGCVRIYTVVLWSPLFTLIKGMVVGTVSHSNASIQEVDLCEVSLNEPLKRLSKLLRELHNVFWGGGGKRRGGGLAMQ